MNEIAPIQEIELADGTRISTASGKIIRDRAETPNKDSLPASTYNHVPTTNRLEDFSVEPKKLNGVAAALCYSLIGLPQQEIIKALGITQSQFDTVVGSSVYTQLRDKLAESILDMNSEDMRLRFAAMSKGAVDKVYEVMNNAEDDIALRAAQDVLDRAGYRPADIVQHRISVAGGLKIEFIKRESSKDLPTLEG
jgi:hypothetical protein